MLKNNPFNPRNPLFLIIEINVNNMNNLIHNLLFLLVGKIILIIQIRFRLKSV